MNKFVVVKVIISKIMESNTLSFELLDNFLVDSK